VKFSFFCLDIVSMDIKRMDLNLLVALDALLDERNVTRAADRLALSQPALSGALARLRVLLGDPLFIRAQRGLVPTPRAIELAPSVKRIVQEAQDLLRPSAFDPAVASGQLTIATTDYMQATLVVPLLETLRSSAPGITIVVRSLELSDIPARLERGDLDLGITIPEFAPPELRSRLLYRERYAGAARKGHPIFRNDVSVEALCAYPHVLVAPRGGAPHGPVDDALAATGHRRSIALAVPTFLILPHALRRTDLLAVAPERLLRGMERDLRLFEVPVLLAPFNVIAVWHPRVQNEPRHRWVRHHLAEVVGQGNGRR
jgi:DNA-binding transcriptional LysR family regulator